MTDRISALMSLVPGAEFVINGTEETWINPTSCPVTEEEIQAEIDRLKAAYAAKDYQRNRAKEYPDFREYLDGVVKGDQAQIDAYIAACMAVKEKYPKPEQP